MHAPYNKPHGFRPSLHIHWDAFFQKLRVHVCMEISKRQNIAIIITIVGDPPVFSVKVLMFAKSA